MREFSSILSPKNDRPQTQPDPQHNLTETEIETIAKLRKFGLDSPQIAEALKLSLDEIEKLKSEEVS